MASKYAIETVYKLIDNITAPLDKIGIKGKVVGRGLKNDFLKTEQQLANVGKKLKTFGKYAVGAGIGAIGVGLGIAAKQFVDFDSSLHAASAAFSDMNPSAADFTERMDVLGKAARNVAAITEFNAQQTAQGLSILARAGLDSVNAIGLLPKITDLATAGMVNIDEAVGMATSTMNIFGKNLDEFGERISDPEKLAGNMKYISDFLAQTADMANHSVADVVGAASTGGSMFKETNQSIENFGAITAVLADVNKTGTEAGTMIRNIMLRLSAPAASGAKALKQLGIGTKDSKGNLLNIVDIVAQFEKKMKGLGTADKAAYLDAIFGKQNVEAAKAIINAGSDKLLEYTAKIEQSSGAAAQKAAVMRNSLKTQIEVLKSGLTELGFKFVEAFSKNGSDAIKKLTDAVNDFNPVPIINFLKTAFNVISKVVSVLWNLRHVIGVLVAGWGIYKAAMFAAVIVSNSFAVVSGAVKTVMFFVTLATKGQAAALALLKANSVAAKIATIAFTAAEKITIVVTKVWTAVQAVLNVVLTANPIGLIITAIGALIAAIVLCIVYWDEITGYVKQGQEALLGFVSVVTGQFGFIISIFVELWNGWNRITQAFTNGGIVEGLKQIGFTILSALLAPIQGVFELLGKIPGVGKYFKGFAGGIDSFRNQIKGIEEPQQEGASFKSYGLSKPVAAYTASPSGAAPVSAAQQLSYYSRQDNYQHAEISVKAEQGTSARLSKPAASPNFNLAVSGGY